MASPDLWDSICFAFLENVAYIPVSGAAVAERSVAEAVESEVDDLFAEV
jgi:hypothetical protein